MAVNECFPKRPVVFGGGTYTPPGGEPGNVPVKADVVVVPQKEVEDVREELPTVADGVVDGDGPAETPDDQPVEKTEKPNANKAK